MPVLLKKHSPMLKAQIFDLSEKAAKQALFAMVDILVKNPSILSTLFRSIIEDATDLTRVVKENQKREVP